MAGLKMGEYVQPVLDRWAEHWEYICSPLLTAGPKISRPLLTADKTGWWIAYNVPRIHFPLYRVLLAMYLILKPLSVDLHVGVSAHFRHHDWAVFECSNWPVHCLQLAENLFPPIWCISAYALRTEDVIS
jgi:hypothetical protein